MSATATVPAPNTTTPPPAAVWPRPLRWTVAQFHAVGSTGIFEGRRPMLLRGVLLEQGMMNEPHATAVELVNEVLRGAFGAGWRVRCQLPLVLSLDTDPMPDFAILPGDVRTAPRAHPTTAALVVEVSDTTLSTDMTEKAELYATAGVPEYWVLDLNARCLHAYRDPRPLAGNLSAVAYQSHATLGPADTISPTAAPNSAIRVADLLP